MNNLRRGIFALLFAIPLVVGGVSNGRATGGERLSVAAICCDAGAFEIFDGEAQKILDKARAALGDEAKLKTVESLSAEGAYKREGGGLTTEGGLNLYFNRSGQYARSEFSASPQGGKMFFDRVLDGDKGSLKPRLEGNDNVRFRGFDDEKTQAEERERMLIDYQAQMLALLLAAPPSPIDFVYAGKQTVGGADFETIEARGQNDFAARLFFDPASFRLAKLTYKGFLQRPAGTRRVNRQMDGSLPDEAENQPGENRKAQNEEITLTVAEYKSVDGISLPHRLVKTAADGAREIWEFKTFRLNAPKAAGLK